MSIQVFRVEGMSCKNCKAHVENGIKALAGIEDVVADFQTGQVKVKGSNVDADLIRGAVEKAGYKFKGTDKSPVPGSDLWLS
jgi:copper chaperone CopZ